MKILLVVSLMASMSLVTLVTTKDPKWKRLRAADFPAHVKAVVFDRNTVLDSEHFVSWGAWKAQFGSERPIAKNFYCTDDICPQFVIDNLDCTNSVVGTRPCWLTIWWGIAGGVGGYCHLYIKENEKDFTQIRITCPDDVQFDR